MFNALIVLMVSQVHLYTQTHQNIYVRYVQFFASASVISQEEFPGGSDGKESACIVGDHGEGNGSPLQYSCLEKSMDRGAWQAIVHGVEKSWT